MNHDDPHPTISDEDLSATIDGQADEAIEAAVAADPAATARRDELAAAASALRALPAPELHQATIDDLVTTALDAPVAPARPARGRGPSPWLVAAVLVVLVAVGLGLIWNGTHGSSDSSATKFNTVGASINAESSKSASDSAAGSSASGSLADGAATTLAPTTTVPPTAGPTSAGATDLGTYPSADALRSALATGWADTSGSATSPAPTAEALDRCDQQLKVTLSLPAGSQHRGYATVAGKPVLVYEFASTSFKDGSPTTLVAAVGPEACNQVIIFER